MQITTSEFISYYFHWSCADMTWNARDGASDCWSVKKKISSGVRSKNKKKKCWDNVFISSCIEIHSVSTIMLNPSALCYHLHFMPSGFDVLILWCSLRRTLSLFQFSHKPTGQRDGNVDVPRTAVYCKMGWKDVHDTLPSLFITHASILTAN